MYGYKDMAIQVSYEIVRELFHPPGILVKIQYKA